MKRILSVLFVVLMVIIALFEVTESPINAQDDNRGDRVVVDVETGELFLRQIVSDQPEEIQITDIADVIKVGPALSPDGETVYFVCVNHDEYMFGDICTVDISETETLPITDYEVFQAEDPEVGGFSRIFFVGNEMYAIWHNTNDYFPREPFAAVVKVRIVENRYADDAVLMVGNFFPEAPIGVAGSEVYLQVHSGEDWGWYRLSDQQPVSCGELEAAEPVFDDPYLFLERQQTIQLKAAETVNHDLCGGIFS